MFPKMFALCKYLSVFLFIFGVESFIIQPKKFRLSYLSEREKLIKSEFYMGIGNNIVLSNKEEAANEVLMKFKREEIDRGFENSSTFYPAKHFFQAKKYIEESEVFKIIKRMPKGGSLHTHLNAILGVDYIVDTMTYRDDLYVCQCGDVFKFTFFLERKPETTCDNWKLINDLREEAENITEFDNKLKRLFTLETENPREKYKNIDDVWSAFEVIFDLVDPLFHKKSAFEKYLYDALRQCRDDGIFYLETRTSLNGIYDDNNNEYDKITIGQIMKDVSDKFMKDYPDFIGFKFIYAEGRTVDNALMMEYIKDAILLKNTFGDFMAGFDLVGQEDKGKPLKDFYVQLKGIPSNIDVFYHAGETNWYGTSTDNNLIDAILLGTKRIGHAYALLKHPAAALLVKTRKIGLEVCPLSSQVLMLVEDLRNHPGSVMIADDYPVVISSDDPGFWGALPSSHDMYLAFMVMASRDADIRLLKQFALNSIEYSAISRRDKADAYAMFEIKWNEFITFLAGKK